MKNRTAAAPTPSAKPKALAEKVESWAPVHAVEAEAGEVGFRE